jgi:hypothetical protein
MGSDVRKNVPPCLALIWLYSQRSRRTDALRVDVPAMHSQSKIRADAEAEIEMPVAWR